MPLFLPPPTVPQDPPGLADLRPPVAAAPEHPGADATRLPLGIEYNSKMGFRDPDAISSVAESAIALPQGILDYWLLSDPLQQTSGERAGNLAAGLFLNLLNVAPVSFVTHEYGHFRFAYQQGFTNQFFSFSDGVKAADSDVISSYGIFWRQIGRQLRGDEVYQAADDGIRGAGEPVLTSRQEIQFFVLGEAAGSNQQFHNLDRVSEHILRGEGSPLDAASWYANFLGPLLLPSSDGGDYAVYRSDLNDLGIFTSVSEVRRSQLLRLLSNSHLSLCAGLGEYVAGGSKEITPISTKIGDVECFWPEFRGHLTLFGPTIGGELRQRYRDHTLLVGMESSLAHASTELDLGWQASVYGPVQLAAHGFYNTDTGGWAAEFRPGIFLPVSDRSNFALGMSYSYFDGYTFHGEWMRDSPHFWEPKDDRTTWWVSWDMRF